MQPTMTVEQTSTTSNAVVAMTGKLASAASIATPFQTSIADAITQRRQAGKTTPKLIGILATPSPPSVAYAQWTKKACEQVGIEFEIWQTWSESTTSDDDAMETDETHTQKRPSTDLEADVEDLIIAANGDDSIHGIMVYYPIFGGRQDTYLQQIVDPRKDVEGLHFSYCFNMYHNIRWISPSQLGGAPGTTIEASAGSSAASEDSLPPPGYAKSILPCTPLAVVKCLESMGAYDSSLPYGDRLYGKTITVVNRSEVVGRPLAALLSNDGAKVYSVDIDSNLEFNKRAQHDSDRQPSKTVVMARERNAAHRIRPHHVVRPCPMSVQECIAASDVVISGVPSASFKIDTAWIKQGAVTVNFSSEKNFEKDVRSRASVHLPAIGKTTIAMLQRNLLRLVEYRELVDSAQSSSSKVNGFHKPDGDAGNGRAEGQHDGHNEGGPIAPPSQSTASQGQSSTAPRDGGATSSRDFDQASQLSTLEEADSATEDEENVKRVRTTNSFASSPYAWQRSTPTMRRASLSRSGPRDRASTLSFARQGAVPSPPVNVRRVSHGPPGAGTGEAAAAAAAAPPPLPAVHVHGGQGTWDWRSPATRSDSIASATYFDGAPPFTPVMRQASHAPQTPLLFAPIGGSSAGVPSRQVVGQGSGQLASASSPRSSTPVSPLIIDGLSVEDNGSSSHVDGSSESQRLSWDSGPPRTPYDSYEPLPPSRGGPPNSVPSVLGSHKDSAAAQPVPLTAHPHHGGGHAHFAHTPYDEKMTLDDDPRRASMAVMSSHYPQQQGYAPRSPRPLSADEQQQQQQQLTSFQPPAYSSDRGAVQHDRIAHSRRRRRPPFSYSSLIAQAISSAPEGRMTLREIYTWISNAYPDMYSMEGSEGSGWQNTVRHNLSLNKAFVKVARTAQDIYDSCSSGVPSLSQQARGKGGWWMLDPNVNPNTIGASAKGDGMDDDANFRTGRMDSIAASAMSEDGDLLSPMPVGTPMLHPHSIATANAPLPPSVLQHHQQQRGRAYTTGLPSQQQHQQQHQRVGEGVPSVLRATRPRSVERSVSQPEGVAQHQHQHQHHDVATQGPQAAAAARLIAGRARPRGYTTSSADLHNANLRPSPLSLHQALPPALSPRPSPLSPHGYGVSNLSPVNAGPALPPYAQPHASGVTAASPMMPASRYPAAAPPTPGQGAAQALYSAPQQNLQKRKSRFIGAPLQFGENGNQQQQSMQSPGVRSAMLTHSPLSGARAVLGPPPPPPPPAGRRETPSETVEREANGSRMSITGLLNV